MKCLPYLQKYGINNIYIPTPDGWKRKPLDIAIEEAREFRNESYRKRQRELIGNYAISMIQDNLLSSKQLRIS